jgi:hypothetical protein
VASPNPGISAAGEAAGRTALNPFAGPAAIGGMLVPGEEPEEEPEIETSGATEMETRLSSAVSDIAKLANALEALSIVRPREHGISHSESSTKIGPAGEPAPTMTVVDATAADGGSSRPAGFGTANGEPGNSGGYAASPGASVETQRQVAGHYRM